MNILFVPENNSEIINDIGLSSTDILFAEIEKMETGETLCDECGEPISEDDLYNDDYCWEHEGGCPNLIDPGSVDCECNLNYHTKCCPRCNNQSTKESTNDRTNLSRPNEQTITHS